MRFFILFLIFSPMGLSSYLNDSGSLEVIITGIRNGKGQILISIYDVPKTFPKTKGMLEQHIVFPVTAGEMQFKFRNLDIGRKYAIAVLHDEDGNEKMTKNMIGFPKEGYCFSKNVIPTFKAPNFDKCSFILEMNTIINIEMLY